MGLLKTGLKAAVAVKTADVIHERIQARQQAQWAAYGQPGQVPGAPAPAGLPGHAGAVAPAAPAAPAPAAPAAPAAAAPAVVDNETMLAQLTQLGELRASEVLTDAEFEAQKARILAG